jgi:hypothetical protein
VFANYANKTTEAPVKGPWRFGKECIDCASQNVNSDSTIAFPKWGVTDNCVNCDSNPSNAKPTKPDQGFVIEQDVKCDGYGDVFSRVAHTTCDNTTSANCGQQLLAIGRQISYDISLTECAALVAENPNCGNVFSWKYESPSKCFCYNSNQACCNTCSRVPTVGVTTYELTSTSDPTCANGVLSSDGKACCTASCGAGNCKASSNVNNAIGFCCPTCITRSCSEFGAPCLVA